MFVSYMDSLDKFSQYKPGVQRKTCQKTQKERTQSQGLHKQKAILCLCNGSATRYFRSLAGHSHAIIRLQRPTRSDLIEAPQQGRSLGDRKSTRLNSSH